MRATRIWLHLAELIKFTTHEELNYAESEIVHSNESCPWCIWMMPKSRFQITTGSAFKFSVSFFFTFLRVIQSRHSHTQTFTHYFNHSYLESLYRLCEGRKRPKPKRAEQITRITLCLLFAWHWAVLVETLERWKCSHMRKFIDYCCFLIYNNFNKLATTQTRASCWKWICFTFHKRTLKPEHVKHKSQLIRCRVLRFPVFFIN